jgi:hypothetical protein
MDLHVSRGLDPDSHLAAQDGAQGDHYQPIADHDLLSDFSC